MRLLIDTNVVIPLEPTRREDIHMNTPAAAELVRLVMQHGHSLFVHPAIHDDIAHDGDDARRETRLAILPKYPVLPHPPPSTKVDAALGTPARDSNDWVDHQLLAALSANAVDFLVTEDGLMTKKARRLGLDGRVFTIPAAAAYLASLLDVSPPPPPAVRETFAHTLNASDDIFTSFREDYGEAFDSWFHRCQTEQRRTWVVDVGTRHAAFMIVNEEKNSAEQQGGKTLKICSFKVSEEFRGFRFGELLLKSVFAFAESNRYIAAFVTVFAKHEELIALLEDFGFNRTGGLTRLGELILVKKFAAHSELEATLSPLTFHIRYGPGALRSAHDPAFVIPIQPRYSDVLFPETARSSTLFPGHFPFGNGLRKAYLSRASMRALPEGATLYFYRSQDERGIIAAGVLERIVVSQQPDEIAREVERRTVYTLREIEELCSQGPVLALLFRQARVLLRYTGYEELVRAGVLRYPPQSIQRVGEEGGRWLFQRTAG
ncbi:MAG TPA: GNAT family N-acetyltransferase [Thermoanaerobaculia bacterium]|nr:GNAT family N-acetyltransferase [Thermoanaerobaculia bacterium]